MQRSGVRVRNAETTARQQDAKAANLVLAVNTAAAGPAAQPSLTHNHASATNVPENSINGVSKQENLQQRSDSSKRK